MRQFLLAFALLGAAPGVAAPAPEPQAIDLRTLSDEMSAYGAWLMQLDRAQSPVQQMLVRLQADWRTAMAAGNSQQRMTRFRPLIVEYGAIVDRADAALAALETPSFPSLDLPDDLRPATIVSDMREANRGIRNVLAAFDTLLDAMASGDPAAEERATTALIGSARLVVQSRARLTRASLAATPREESSWEMVNVELLLLRAGDRALAAWPERGPAGSDSSLSADLLALAAELEQTADAGIAKADSEAAEYAASLADAREAGDPEAAAIFQRTRDTLVVSRRIFPLARELAAILRRESPAFASGRFPLSALARLVQAMQPIRLRMDEITREEAAALAGAI